MIHPDSRRNFVKKSLVTSIALAQPSIFSGLVRATGGGEGDTTEVTTGPETTAAYETTWGDVFETTVPVDGSDATTEATMPESTVPETTGITTTIPETTIYPKKWYIRCTSAPALNGQTIDHTSPNSTSGYWPDSLKLGARCDGPEAGDKALATTGFVIKVTSGVTVSGIVKAPSTWGTERQEALHTTQTVKGNHATLPTGIVFNPDPQDYTAPTTHPLNNNPDYPWVSTDYTGRNLMQVVKIHGGEVTSVWANWSANGACQDNTVDLLVDAGVGNQKWEFELIEE